MTATTPDRSADLLQDLRAGLRGTVFAPGDEGYDTARRARNLNAEHRPALVVLAESAEDIRCRGAVRPDGGLGVGVLATGHGTGTPCDGGLLINTSRMRGVRVDPDARVARVEAGAVWDDVVEAAAAHGLAGLPGSSTKVGVVGYTLGGGFGWLGRRYGLAVHSVTRAEVVTADGDWSPPAPTSTRTSSGDCKGGTGNLGIVTALEFALHPGAARCTAGTCTTRWSEPATCCGFFADWSRSAPLELTAAVTFRTFPPLPTVPEPLRGSTLVALRGCFCGDPRRRPGADRPGPGGAGPGEGRHLRRDAGGRAGHDQHGSGRPAGLHGPHRTAPRSHARRHRRPGRPRRPRRPVAAGRCWRSGSSVGRSRVRPTR